VIRGYRETDEPQIGALLVAAWPHDPVLVEVSALHGPDLDENARLRRTLVAEEDGSLIGAATLLGTSRHPTFFFFTAVVAPERRRQGIATALLDELQRTRHDRPLLARVRETDDGAIAFLRANGFGVRMRSRSVSVDPADDEVVAWVAQQPQIELERPAARDQVAHAHEQAYQRVHAGWAPTTERPLDESLRAFCAEGWLPEASVLARDGAEVVGVASLYGKPFVFAGDGLFLIADTLRADERALRSLVASQLESARRQRVRVAFEADEANQELWRLIHALPGRLDPELLLFSTDADP
jgi:ribosomal protein S18 acetylase RimI-like enzyme